MAKNCSISLPVTHDNTETAHQQTLRADRGCYSWEFPSKKNMVKLLIVLIPEAPLRHVTVNFKQKMRGNRQATRDFVQYFSSLNATDQKLQKRKSAEKLKSGTLVFYVSSAVYTRTHCVRKCVINL